MADLKIREEKIKAKRKQTPWRDFVRDLASWISFSIYKNGDLVSGFPSSDRINIVSNKEYDRYTNVLVSKNIDGKLFFLLLKELISTTPQANMTHFGNCENVDYALTCHNAKNAYLSHTVTFGSSNVMYSVVVKHDCHNVLNSLNVIDNCENIYASQSISESKNIFFSSYIRGSNNIWMSDNLIGCAECINCSNLTNVSYCIENKEYKKDEYFIEKDKALRNKEIHKNHKSRGNNIESHDAEGNNLVHCDHVKNAFDCSNIDGGNNLILATSNETCTQIYDSLLCGRIHNVYGLANGGGHSANLYCCHLIVNSSNLYYCINCEGCSFCLGCIGLKNKSFCILNKEYSKEERYELANKIFQQMDKDGSLGKFFPGSMNPFYFNDTAAYLIDDSFTKEEVTKEGYLRRDEEIKIDIPIGADVVETKDLASYQGFDTNGNRTINPDILKKVIKDEKGNYYRIVKMEYDFLMKYGLPLPELHWLDRIKLGFKFK